MAGNSFLSPTAIAREALRILHSNSTFFKHINRQYDDKFANTGATMSGKIGPSLTVKYPNKYTVTTGAQLNLQDTTETSTTISVSTQKHVDMYFTSADLTLTIDEFSERYLKPAGLLLASTIDQDGLALYNQIYQCVGETAAQTTGGDPAHASVPLAAAQKLQEANAPQDGMNTIILSPKQNASMVNGMTGFFNPQTTISSQFEKGLMSKNTLGFDWYYDSNVASQTYGTRPATAALLTITTATASLDAGATTITCSGAGSYNWKVGDIVSFTACYSVNPETKQSTGSLQQFVVATAATGGGSNVVLTVSPAIYQSGAQQNMTGLAQGATGTNWGTASYVAQQGLAFHRDFATLVTADLVLPKGVDFAAREVFDGISLRIVRAYDINNDRLPVRMDVLYGYKVLYPQLACRISS